jgi:retinol dehydrogenase-12
MSTPSSAWDIAGKSVLITGATSGIGQAGAIELARRGAVLSVLGRSPAKLDALATEIAAKAGGASITTFLADLSDLDRVREVAGEILAALPRIDVLINNAGIAARSSKVGPSGYDEMMAGNYLGPFLLTHLLLARLEESSPSRLIFTASEAHRLTGGLDVQTLEQLGEYHGFSGQLAYGTTKLLDLLAADELARRVDPSKVTVLSFCPGAVNTGLIGDGGSAVKVGNLLSRTPAIRTPEQGARKMVELATTPSITGGDGGFHTSTPLAGLVPRRRIRKDLATVRAVYERTCALVGVSPVG